MRSTLIVLLASGCTLIANLGDRRFEDLPDAGEDDGGDDRFDAGMMDAGCDFTRCPDLACADLDNDPLHCGACDNPCIAPDNADATCSIGSCGFACRPGYMQVVGECVTRTIPRATAPLSTSTVTSRRPTFRWELGTSIDGARVELCADRDCASVIETIDVTGTSARPTDDLPPGVVFWRLYGRSGTEVGAEHSPPWEIFVGQRSAPIDTSWGTVLDINGDGFADVALGDPTADSNTGRVDVYFGRATGLGETPDVSFVGPDGTDGRFGTELTSAGDVNGDGVADLAVRAPGASRVHIFFGGRDTIDPGPAHSFEATVRVASAGDFNGDGFADFVSQAQLYRGGPSGLTLPPIPVRTNDPDALTFGAAAAAAVVNGDGLSDLVIGAPGTLSAVGRVYVFFGETGERPAYLDDQQLTGPGPASSEYGRAIACAGDVNGDGFIDVIVGAPGTGFVGNPGATYVHNGSADGLVVETPTSLTRGSEFGFGVALATGFDLDADGFGDVLVTAISGRSSPRPEVLIYHGSAGGIAATASRSLSQYFNAVGVGDITSDGFDDVTMGGGGGVGLLQIFFGSTDGIGSTPTDTLP